MTTPKTTSSGRQLSTPAVRGPPWRAVATKKNRRKFASALIGSTEKVCTEDMLNVRSSYTRMERMYILHLQGTWYRELPNKGKDRKSWPKNARVVCWRVILKGFMWVESTTVRASQSLGPRGHHIRVLCGEFLAGAGLVFGRSATLRCQSMNTCLAVVGLL